MIPIEQESADLYENTYCYERCVFCRITTNTWHTRTNNPVCKTCCKTHMVHELEDHGRLLRNKKRREKRKKLIEISNQNNNN